MNSPPVVLELTYFDGHSARPQQARIWLADGRLYLCALAERSYPLRQVQWPERQRHGQRQALLPDGGVLSCDEPSAWDAWAQASGLSDSLTVRWMQSWRGALAAAVLLPLLLLGLWRWGAPLVADVALHYLPPAVEAAVGEQAFMHIEKLWLAPSKLDPARQQRLRERFEALLHASGMPQPGYRLHFRAASKALGPNALALPGGDIILTDALVELLHDHEDGVLGVLAHELGHVKHRHGMRLMIQAGLLGAGIGLFVGDYATLMSLVPTALAHAGYSRDAERQADQHARELLRAAGVSTQGMLVFFERLQARDPASRAVLPIAFSSHPSDASRRAFFASR